MTETERATRLKTHGFKVAIASFIVAATLTGLTVSFVYGAESERGREARPAATSPPSVPDAARLFSNGANTRVTIAKDAPVVRATASYKQDPEALVVHAVERAGASVKLSVGEKSVCFQVSVASGAGSLGCAPAVSATDPDRPIIAVDTYGDNFRVSGAMIDGVSEIELHLADGSVVRPPLAANVFSVEVSGIPLDLTYRKPDGSAGKTKLEH